MGSNIRKALAKIERQLDDYAEIKAIWQKHEMPQRCGDMAMSLNEVLLHYKGYLAAEKQAKAEAYRGRFEKCVAEAKQDEHLNLLRGVKSCRMTATEQVMTRAQRGEPGAAMELAKWWREKEIKDNKPCPHHETKHDNITGHWFCKSCGKFVTAPEVIT